MYRMQICFGFKIFFFFFKAQTSCRPNLEFRPVFTETPEIDRNDMKFFQSGIGTPWTKFLESTLVMILSQPRKTCCATGSPTMPYVTNVLATWNPRSMLYGHVLNSPPFGIRRNGVFGPTPALCLSKSCCLGYLGITTTQSSLR